MTSSKQMGVVEFGDALLSTGDLDPVYLALVEADLPPDRLKRLLVAYWCFYHLGVACFISSSTGAEFWDWMTRAAENKIESPAGGRWPRSAERRHFRGAQATSAVAELRARYPQPEAMVDYIVGPSPVDFPKHRDAADIMKRAKEHRGFGDWIAFKVADMVETVLKVDVSFVDAEIFMFSSPVEGARLVYETQMKCDCGEPPVWTASADQLGLVVAWLTEQLGEGRTAPPSHRRRLGIQEIETVLCKWKSHLSGSYPAPGKDIHELRHGLREWADFSIVASVLMAHVPKEVA